jgi:hypothetical protein
MIVLLAIGFTSIIGFIPIFVGIIGYFTDTPGERKLHTIYKTIKEGGLSLVFFSVLETAALTFSLLNIAAIRYPAGIISQIVLSVSWIILTLAGWWLLFAPIILVRMRVTFKQLLANSVLIFAHGGVEVWILIALGAGTVYLGLIFPYALAIGIYVLCLAIYIVTNPIIERLKKKGDSQYEETLQSISHSR